MKAVQLNPPKRRRLRQPSERNLQVYREVREVGETQAAVAERHGVSQERVSQICRQVARWLARSTESDRHYDGPPADLVLARFRYQKMFALAAAELAKGDVQLVTEKVRRFGDEQQSERITRSLPLSPQWGKLVVVIADRLARLDAKLGPDEARELAMVSPPQESEGLKSSTTSTSARDRVAIHQGNDGAEQCESDWANVSCDELVACGVQSDEGKNLEY